MLNVVGKLKNETTTFVRNFNDIIQKKHNVLDDAVIEYTAVHV